MRRPRRRRKLSRYFAFLSYSHKDSELADWLHSELERYKVPRRLTGQLTENGVVPKRLRPIFRDEHELAAADDLGEEIEEALANSQFLIVLCSPAAAISRWTNAEIEAFKRSRPDGCIFAAIASGEPFASEMPGREAEECFPPALRQKFDRRGRPTGKRAEPLAADLRQTGDGRRVGFLKLVAGMLGVGFDDLVQRETTRRQRRLALLAAASIGGMAVTSTLAITAIQARDAAREQRRQAENLVEFMLGDLRGKLEPIGKLDALDGVGSKVLAYYKHQDTSQLTDDALVQRSRALNLMAEVAFNRGNLDEAQGLYRQAMAGTAEAVRRAPNDPDRLFDHAQNVFYVGEVARSAGRPAEAEASWREYKRLADEMTALAPDNLKFRMEVQYAGENLGISLYDQHRFAEASRQFEGVAGPMEKLASLYPGNVTYQKEFANDLAWVADAQRAEGKLDGAVVARERQIAVLNRLMVTAVDSDVRA
jgi:tetratricopeptide (TPR) repeat protein